MTIADLRRDYHRRIAEGVLRLEQGVANLADRSSEASKHIAALLVGEIGGAAEGRLSGQSRGARFEQVTRDFLEASFSLLDHLRPGDWTFQVTADIARFEQYRHLAALSLILESHPELKATLGIDYLVTPDIVVTKAPVADTHINAQGMVIAEADNVGTLTPFRAHNHASATLHASISCKWTIRSDRSQNVRTEALNLIRNCKGHTPHVAVVTAEPLPTRLASIALGTGDIDHVYHFALYELQRAVSAVGNPDQAEMLETLIQGNRLRDISDLPFDLAI